MGENRNLPWMVSSMLHPPVHAFLAGHILQLQGSDQELLTAPSQDVLLHPEKVRTGSRQSPKKNFVLTKNSCFD